MSINTTSNISAKHVEDTVAVAKESFTQLIDVMRHLVFKQTKEENKAFFETLGAEGMEKLGEAMFLAREIDRLSVSITRSAVEGGFCEIIHF